MIPERDDMYERYPNDISPPENAHLATDKTADKRFAMDTGNINMLFNHESRTSTPEIKVTPKINGQQRITTT